MITNKEKKDLRKILTSRQYEVLELILLKYDRKEIAQTLVPPVSDQAVWQIIPRLKKRLVKHGLIEKYKPYTIL